MTYSEPEKTTKSLKYSILDGSAHAAMLGLTQDYIVPFALALKAATSQIGLLASIPNLAMALSQLFAPRLAEKAGSRKRFALLSSGFHGMLWLPILALPFLIPGDKVWWLIALFTLSTVFGSLGNPAWGSMMADLVPEDMRGRYFGKRGRICGFVTLLFFFIGGLVLQRLSNNIFVGFALLFCGAILFRLVSWCFLSRMYEPSLEANSTEHSSMLELFRNLFKSNLGRFTVYVSLINFATYIAGPFFAVYMLRDLKFDYFTFVVVSAASTLTNLLFLTFWGKRADKLGNAKIVKITSAAIPFTPLLWLISSNIPYLLAIQVIAGIAWAGFNLATSNFVYDAAPPEKRSRYIAMFNALNGSGICLGALLGGFLVTHLPPILGHSFFTLFLVSGVSRGLVVITLVRGISEVRHLPEINTASELIFHLNLAKGKVLKTRSKPAVKSNEVNRSLRMR